MQALKPRTHMLRRGLVRRGSLLLGWLTSPPSCWLTSPSSSHSHSVILTVISNSQCKVPRTTFTNLLGPPESQGLLTLQFPGTWTSFVICSGPRTGCTSLIPNAEFFWQVLIVTKLRPQYSLDNEHGLPQPHT
jgi:hypothetical protein